MKEGIRVSLVDLLSTISGGFFYEQGTRLALLPEKVVVANDANA